MYSSMRNLVKERAVALLALTGVCALVLLCADGSSAKMVCAAPHFGPFSNGFRYEFPPELRAKGLVFAGEKIPIQRADVRDRILKEINYLLMDRRSRVLLWLARSDALKSVILPVLRKYQLPHEFLYLAAIESSYDSRALSSAGAFGYWQFMKATATRGPSDCEQYDWQMSITKWKDERADLVGSSHSAARYLAWMNRVLTVRLPGKKEREGFGNWLLAAAAYNAGPGRVMERLGSYGADSYWDVPLPPETEAYVPRWIAIGIISRHRAFFGVDISRRRRVMFDTVRRIRLRKDLTFAEMARLLNTTPRAIWALNTQIPPEKAVFPARSKRRVLRHDINIPLGTRKKFLAQLKAHGYVKN
ncbi:MAG: lytic transglycosylase domain-containing protein [Deltaproteobacteria bacterium]